ncbi:MAG: peptide ABC transporter substrate-binding protein [Chrysiogenetes bacterium]|nr:peptide ABC transporter substrate-binding protein [Chrysiogenetes bacterium]
MPQQTDHAGASRARLRALLALTLLLLAACHDRRERGIVIANLSTEPPNLDWSRATDHVSFNVISNLMVGLTEFGEGGAITPMVAESWRIEDEGRRYVFTLREDARWSDGRPVTAADFVYSWQRILDPATGSEYAYLMYVLRNARAINEGKLPVESLGVSAPDARTLVAELEAPSAFFLSLTTFEITFPLRRDVVEKHGAAWTEPGKLISNGPYVLTRWDHESVMEFGANPHYFGPAAPTPRARLLMIPEKTTAMTLYDRGELDVMDNHSLDPLDIPQYENDPRFERVPQLRGYYYGINVSRPPFDDVRVRRAFAHAIDRSIFPKILRGSEWPTSSWIPKGMFAFNEDIGLKFDPDKARALLAEAGYPGGKGFPTVTAMFNTAEHHALIAQALQAQWRENLGVEVSIANMEWKVFLDKLQNDPPQMFRMGWGADYPDPDNFMNLFTSYSGNNKGRWKNARYDALVEQAARELDPQKRRDMYDELQRILLEDDAAIIPLFNVTENTIAQPWAEGFHLSAMARLPLYRVRLIEEKMP